VSGSLPTALRLQLARIAAAAGQRVEWVKRQRSKGPAMTASSPRVVTPRTVFQGPGLQVNGLEAVPEGLWLSDQRDNRTYLVDYEGKVLTSFPSPARNASGTSFGAGYVWVSSNVRPAMIFRHDLQTGQCSAYLFPPNPEQGGVHGLQWRPYAAGQQPAAAAPSGPELHPTAPAGKLNAGPGASGTLWVTRPGAKRIDHLDAETGEVLGQIPFPAPRSHGLFWDERDNTLNVAETNGGHIYRLDPGDGEVLDEWQIAGCEVHGLTRDPQGRIWIGDAATNQVLVIE
jgi:streptogramin lyase